jgi:hypothetical protein
MTFAFHMRLADEALTEAKKVFYLGSPHKKVDLVADPYAFKHPLYQRHAEMRSKLTGPPASIERIESVARVAPDYGVGNCGDQAAVVLIYLRDRRYDGEPRPPLDLMARYGVLHGFAVIGRPDDSKVEDWLTWGPAVICDPWDNMAYPASKARELMYAGRGEPRGGPFKAVLTLRIPGAA